MNVFGRRLLESLENDWPSQARPEQLPPDGDWAIWLVLAGRGFGKTRCGAEWVRAQAEAGLASRIALVGPTNADVRDILVGTLLEIAPNSNRPLYEPSKRSLTWPNGVQAIALSSEEPERIRGFGFEIGWLDELCAFRNINETFDLLQFTMRRGRRPRQCITTTPKPIPLLRALLKREDVVITRGKTSDNSANLAKPFLDSVLDRYANTRLGRQELNAEILDDLPGALWSREMIDAARKPVPVPDMARVVVAVDPSGTRGGDTDDGDWIGVMVVGKGVDGRGYVLADRTCKLSPAGWGRRVVDAYHEFQCDRLVAERNYGGAMVEHVIRTVDRNVPIAKSSPAAVRFNAPSP
jgi:phage terminase large subunit-like protein